MKREVLMKPGDYKKLTIAVGNNSTYDFIVVEILGESRFQIDANDQAMWEVKNILSNTCFYVKEEELW
jgi:hypothetical protein